MLDRVGGHPPQILSSSNRNTSLIYSKCSISHTKKDKVNFNNTLQLAQHIQNITYIQHFRKIMYSFFQFSKFRVWDTYSPSQFRQADF